MRQEEKGNICSNGDIGSEDANKQDVVNIIKQDADAVDDAASHGENDIGEMNNLLKITNRNDLIKRSDRIQNPSVLMFASFLTDKVPYRRDVSGRVEVKNKERKTRVIRNKAKDDPA
uniref:Uncharacterized protein n=1 Tax=Glossina palpalis gambiensis TaxID=67801 RepID=A0A1B0AKF6_9MUSC